MFGLMKKHVLRAIDGTRWASRATKREAEAKIDKLHGNFVGTDLFFNYTFLQNRYGQVDITSDFFSNVLQMFKHFRHNIYHFVNAQVDTNTYTWNLISYPFTVNAFHLQQLNSIGKDPDYFLGAMRTNIPTYFWYFPVIPLGLLHDAHYSQNVPKYLNVGSLGLTLAHEILHSLDQMGRGFDANGTRRVSKPPFIFHSFGARKHDRWSSIYDIFSWIETLLKLLQTLFSILFFSRKNAPFFPEKTRLELWKQ